MITYDYEIHRNFENEIKLKLYQIHVPSNQCSIKLMFYQITVLLECIQVFGEIFLNTTPQHNLPFELPSKNYSLPAHFLNFSLLVLYVSVRACVIQKRTLYS